MQKISPLIIALEGRAVTPEFAALAQRLNPLGYILFGRNCIEKEQVSALLKQLKKITPHGNPVLMVDQEGGRVVRMKFCEYIPQPNRTLGSIYKKDAQAAVDAARLSAFINAAQLQEMGFNCNTVPVADVAGDGMHDVIGDRAFSNDPQAVATLCAATISGSLAGGVWPVIKHAPGHGAAAADSHFELPVVSANARDLRLKDFVPFQLNALCPFVMTAHVKYTALDDAMPASQSVKVHEILRGALGMTGVIMGDDIGMAALEGTPMERIQKTLDAGADVALWCGTNPKDGKWLEDGMAQLESFVGKWEMSEESLKRVRNVPPLPEPDLAAVEAAKAELNSILGETADAA